MGSRSHGSSLTQRSLVTYDNSQQVDQVSYGQGVTVTVNVRGTNLLSHK
jgi:hypothetical protein